MTTAKDTLEEITPCTVERTVGSNVPICKDCKEAADKASQALYRQIMEIVKGLDNLGAYEEWGTYNEGFEGCRDEIEKALATYFGQEEL